MAAADSDTLASPGARFERTHWSVVLAASQEDGTARGAALETLCQTYWEPIYAFLRYSGMGAADAQDRTQGFFEHLLQGNRLGGLTPERGKFRSFLLTALKNFLNDHHDRAVASKRGGGQVLVSLDQDSAETHFARDAATSPPPETLFDRRWAATLMNRAFLRLQEEFLKARKENHFLELTAFLGAEGTAGEYAAIGAQLEMTRGAVSVAVHRLRQRFRDLIRAEIAHTVASPAQLDEEMRYLLEVACQ